MANHCLRIDRVTGDPANVECILIADDLTGACDTGAQFVRRGLSCRVQLNLSEYRASATVDVLAFNTNSRNDSADQCRQKIDELAAECSRLKADIIFKKVDSTLRGNVGAEIAAAVRVFECEAAIVAPAYPAMCRVIRNGILHWDDYSGSGRIDICSLFAQQGISPDKLALMGPTTRDLANFASELDMHMMNGKRFFIVDCESQEDLHFVVAAGSGIPRRFLWAGAAGLGISLAAHMARSQTGKSASAQTDAPMLFVIGSNHPATLRQKEALLATTDAVEIVLSREAIADACRALRDKHNLVVTVARGEHGEVSLRQFFAGLEGYRIAAMFITGGDTGTLVCDAIDARSIDLRDEITPGLPWGILSGGMFHGLPVASKSGGFGDENALVRCSEFFAPAKRAVG